MAAEEVTVLHEASTEEVVESSSFKVDIVAEKDKEKEKEDLSNGANVRSVKADTDGDGSYVFVNGNDAVHGDSLDLDLEKNGAGIGEDRGVDKLEIKGEVKSESDLVKDESCIEIVHQDNESMELCHVESPLDEQKSGDLIESGPVFAINAEDGVSETSMAGPNGVSEASADVYDSNGEGLANGITKFTVSEAAVIDSSAKESEVSSVSFSDSNGGSPSKDSSFDDKVVDSRSKENEDSQMVVVDDGDCYGDGLANDNVGSKENEDSPVHVADDGECKGDRLGNDNVEQNVVNSGSKEDEDSEMAMADDRDGLANDNFKENIVDSGSKENEDFEVDVADDSECKGDDLANDSVEVNVVDSSSKENEDSEMTVADDADCNGNGSADYRAEDSDSDGAVVTGNGQNGDDEIPACVSGSNGDTVSEAVAFDSGAEQNDDVPVSVSDNIGDGLPADSVEVTVLEVSEPEPFESSNKVEFEAVGNGNGSVCNDNRDRPEQNAFSGMPETGHADVVSGKESAKGEQNIATDDLPCEGGLDLDLSAERDLSLEADTHLKMEIGIVSISESGEALQQDGISETVPIDDSIDLSQNLQQSKSSEIVENSPSLILNENENVIVEKFVSDATTDMNIDIRASADVVTLNNASVERDENSRVVSDVETLEVEIEIESDPVDYDTRSGWLANGLKSETNISSDSIVSEEAEVSKGFAECDSIEPITVGEKLSVADVQNDSNLAASASVSNDEKAPAVIENLSAVSHGDISGNDGFVHEPAASNCDTNDSEQTFSVTKGGIQFGSVVTCQQPEVLDEVERTRPFHFLIRVPRYDDEDLKEKIRLAQIRVDEKTQSRDAIRIEIQSKRATCKEYGDNFDAAISQERAARDLHRSKRQEIESIQSVMDIEDIDAKIRNMERMIQHETLPLKDEKQFIREIKQLKQNREKLSSNMARQDEVQQGLDQKNQIHERLKSLKKEADELKINLVKAEAVTKAAKKKYHDETEKLNKLQSQFKAADDIRQEAYAQLQRLKKQSYEKNKYFWQYRDDLTTANDLALKGDREALQNFCINQVEKFMDLWNKNDEFHKEYVRCNVRSTLRRLRTLDGRALGPDEEPPVIPKAVNERVVKDHTLSSSASEDRRQEKVALAKAEKANDKPVAKVVDVEQKNQTSKSEKPVKSVSPAIVSTTASSRDIIEEAGEEKPKRTKEEEEAARKAEELRKEEEAAKSREQCRLEEIAKAKEALERKRRNAEKAQARAAVRAQKEAEQKEKEREKRAKKKERRKVAAAAAGDAGVTDESVSAPTSETLAETPNESENKEKSMATAVKRPQKPSSQFRKQTKAKSIPPPLRNRGKRRMQPWLWWLLLTSLVILALFLIGNYNFSFNFGRQWFNF